MAQQRSLAGKLFDDPELKKLGVETVFLVYHLIRGGIMEQSVIEELVGKKIGDIDAVDDIARRLIHGPLAPKKPVRCGGCGNLLVDIPCVTCGPRVQLKYG